MIFNNEEFKLICSEESKLLYSLTGITIHSIFNEIDTFFKQSDYTIDLINRLPDKLKISDNFALHFALASINSQQLPKDLSLKFSLSILKKLIGNNDIMINIGNDSNYYTYKNGIKQKYLVETKKVPILIPYKENEYNNNLHDEPIAYIYLVRNIIEWFKKYSLYKNFCIYLMPDSFNFIVLTNPENYKRVGGLVCKFGYIYNE